MTPSLTPQGNRNRLSKGEHKRWIERLVALNVMVIFAIVVVVTLVYAVWVGGESGMYMLMTVLTLVATYMTAVVTYYWIQRKKDD